MQITLRLSIHTLLICFYLFLVHRTDAQNTPIKFGQISIDELQMTSYKGDKSVSAIVLFDYGNSTPTSFIHHKRIKIINKTGFQWADVAVPIFSNSKLNNLKATTYNLESGNVIETKVDNKLHYREEFNDFLDIMKFAFANVKEGSVIEFKYEIVPNGSFIFLGDQSWEFQNRIPTLWSEYTFVQSRYATYNKLIQGYIPVTLADDSKLDTWRWAMKDVPAFRDEPYSSSYKNYISKVRISVSAILPTYNWPISISSDWDQVRKTYLKSTFENDNIKFSRVLKQKTQELFSLVKSPDEKLAKIYSYVKDKIEWNGRESITIKNSIQSILDKGSANSGEINLILLSMLRYAGINAFPVLISTRENGRIRKEIPDFAQFNRVLILVDIDGKRKLIDATDRFLSLDFLSERCINGDGLLMTLEGIEWLSTVEISQRGRELISAEFKLTSDGDMVGKLTLSKTGYQAGKARKDYFMKGKEKFIEEVFSSHHAELKEAIIEGNKETESPFIENYTLSLLQTASVINDKIYFIPILYDRINQNPFNANEREYPIDFTYKREVVYTATVTIPDGYKIDEIPKSTLSVLPGNAGKFLFSIKGQGDVLTISTQLIISRVLFGQDEHSLLREFYNGIVAKHSEQIVLTKK
jgi:hypothetical protein